MLGRTVARSHTARKGTLWISLALGTFVLLGVPIYSALVADPRVLTDEQYITPACRWPLPFSIIPEPICPRVFAGESPLTVLYALILVPLLLLRSGARTMLTVAILSLVFALGQVPAAFYATFPSALDPASNPSPFRREPGCGLVLCGLDHTLFHLSQMVLLLAMAFNSYRAYQAMRRGQV